MMENQPEAGPANVDRFWRQVERSEGVEHLYASLLGLRTYETAGLHSRVADGLSYAALERLRRALDIPVARIAAILGIAPRTLARRKDAGRLEPEESDRLLRLSRLVGLTLKLFEGDLGRTRSWLSTPHHALGGDTPLDFATTGIGAREVEHLIGRLEHGIVP